MPLSPFPDSSFNIVIIQAVLEHVLNPQKVVKEINRVLKNKGIIYSETPFYSQFMKALDFQDLHILDIDGCSKI